MKKPTRQYVLKARGEHMAETRARIVEALMRLHQEVGPRNTTVSAVATRAGVERLTVYRHFRNEAEMFDACSHRYLELNPPPDPAVWADKTDPAQRTRRGLDDIYVFLARTSPMLEKIYRDLGECASLKPIMDRFDGYLRDLADQLAAAWPRDKRAARRRVTLRHAVKFATWQSLEAEGVDNDQKITLMLEWLGCSTKPGHR